MKLGPKARAQLSSIALAWKAGEHVLITGGTGSGKTLLARYLAEIRLRAGSSVVVFVCKLQPDATLEKYYPASAGWKRWKTWPDKTTARDQRIIFWPHVEGLTAEQAVEVFRREIPKALNAISKRGKWVVILDEGKYVTSPHGVGVGALVGHMYELMRSAKGTMITLAQRPSNLPLTIYSNVSQAFVSRAPNADDLKRLADLDSKLSGKELQALISKNGKHDFTWLDIDGDGAPQKLNLAQ